MRLNQINDIIKSDPLLQALKVQVTALTEGSVTMSMLVESEKHTNPEGFIHNGILFRLVDLAMGGAILTTGYFVRTNSISISLVPNALQSDKVIAAGTMIAKRDSFIVAEAKIMDEKKRLFAKAQGSYLI
ncbi:PaaI family thioesterase [uncultured Sporomusa sp.]|uniref:PaaI family thioesterase n=1 Tax=uncultured Sporomusa sp. TaxID=307249 RepID=UPI00259020E5|nr:PaaI family thioesterase [uncultured Sporomusa sp.]